MDYVTEKLWRALRMGGIPVYLGAPNLASFEPLPGAVIRAQDFRSMADLAAHLRRVAADETAYSQHLAFKTDRRVSQAFADAWLTPRPSWQCRLCAFVSQRRQRQFWEDRSCMYKWGHY